MNATVWCITIVLAYLLGSIPTGYVVGRIMGKDIRTLGSGNIGATNAFRILGKGPGLIVLVGDGLKGWLATALVPMLVINFFDPSIGEDVPEQLKLVAGIIAILGHNYTFWLKFKGGKGVATSAGVLAALMPWAFVIVLTVWIIMAWMTRYVSVASICAAGLLPIAAWLTGGSPTLIIVALIIGGLVIYKHKTNVERLRAGTENKIGRKARCSIDKI